MLARKVKEEKKRQYGDVAPRTRHEVQPRRQTIREHRIVMRDAMRKQLLIIFFVTSFMAALITFQSGQIASKGYELGQLQEETIRLEVDNAQLRVDNAKLKSPQRIKDIAAGEYGMTTPNKVYFASDKVLKKN